MLPLYQSKQSMFGLFGNQPKLPESWKQMESIQELEVADQTSYNKPVVLFKHSTSCSISSMAKSRLEGDTDVNSPEIYYLDLLAYRDVSNTIADKYGVRHESPQVIVLSNGQATYHASHGRINMNDLKANAH
jgi:bacillithiol system protein YtxJ